MTVLIKVSVNGNYKIPVKQGEKETIVSGRQNCLEGKGPNVVDFYPTHGDGSVFIIGPEIPDNGGE